MRHHRLIRTFHANLICISFSWARPGTQAQAPKQCQGSGPVRPAGALGTTPRTCILDVKQCTIYDVTYLHDLHFCFMLCSKAAEGPAMAPPWGWHCHGTAIARSWQRRCSGKAVAQPPWHCHGTAMPVPWHCHGTSVALLWHCRRPDVALPQDGHGTALALPWHCHGTSMAPPWHCHHSAMGLEQDLSHYMRRGITREGHFTLLMLECRIGRREGEEVGGQDLFTGATVAVEQDKAICACMYVAYDFNTFVWKPYRVTGAHSQIAGNATMK